MRLLRTPTVAVPQEALVELDFFGIDSEGVVIIPSGGELAQKIVELEERLVKSERELLKNIEGLCGAQECSDRRHMPFKYCHDHGEIVVVPEAVVTVGCIVTNKEERFYASVIRVNSVTKYAALDYYPRSTHQARNHGHSSFSDLKVIVQIEKK